MLLTPLPRVNSKPSVAHHSPQGNPQGYADASQTIGFAKPSPNSDILESRYQHVPSFIQPAPMKQAIAFNEEIADASYEMEQEGGVFAVFFGKTPTKIYKRPTSTLDIKK